MSVPGGDVGLSLSHVGSEVRNIEFPSAVSALVLKILDEYLCPLGTRNIFVDGFNSLGIFQVGNIHISGDTNISLKFLIGFIIGMIQWTTFKVNNSSASIHIINSGSKGDLSSKTMTSISGHSQFLLVHKSSDISRDVLHLKAFMMVRVTHVSVVDEPYVSNIEDLFALTFKEFLKVGCGFNKIGEPEHCWEVRVLALEESSSELDGLSRRLFLGLGTNHSELSANHVGGL